MQEAIARCREAVARKPENEEAWFLLGVLLQETGELSQAEAAFEKSTALVPNSSPSLHLALPLHFEREVPMLADARGMASGSAARSGLAESRSIG